MHAIPGTAHGQLEPLSFAREHLVTVVRECEAVLFGCDVAVEAAETAFESAEYDVAWWSTSEAEEALIELGNANLSLVDARRNLAIAVNSRRGANIALHEAKAALCILE